MGLQFGYDENKKKWYAKGLWFIRYYDTEEAMLSDAHDATNAYFEKRKSYFGFAMSFAALRNSRNNHRL